MQIRPTSFRSFAFLRAITSAVGTLPLTSSSSYLWSRNYLVGLRRSRFSFIPKLFLIGYVKLLSVCSILQFFLFEINVLLLLLIFYQFNLTIFLVAWLIFFAIFCFIRFIIYIFIIIGRLLYFLISLIRLICDFILNTLFFRDISRFLYRFFTSFHIILFVIHKSFRICLLLLLLRLQYRFLQARSTLLCFGLVYHLYFLPLWWLCTLFLLFTCLVCTVVVLFFLARNGSCPKLIVLRITLILTTLLFLVFLLLFILFLCCTWHAIVIQPILEPIVHSWPRLK